MTALKYSVGYFEVPGHGIIPTPYELWPENYKQWVTPLYVIFAVAWSLEIVSHLEELNFWLFLLNQSGQFQWFQSIHFKTWAAGSLIAVVGMPLVAIFNRSDPLRCEAWTFFAGSVGSLLITIWFFNVLWRFPTFIKRIKGEGAEPEVVIRLCTFHELNVIRVVFRLMFVGSLFILAVDGVIGSPTDHHAVNENPFWTDLLALFAGVGCMVSSCLTLLVFFPRSIAQEAGYSAHQRQSQVRSAFPPERSSVAQPKDAPQFLQLKSFNGQGEEGATPASLRPQPPPPPTGVTWDIEDLSYEQMQSAGVRYSHLRHNSPEVRHAAARSLHPYIASYTSPINI
jgi:hypothetical protein